VGFSLILLLLIVIPIGAILLLVRITSVRPRG